MKKCIPKIFPVQGHIDFFLHTKFYKLLSNYNEAIYSIKNKIKVPRPRAAKATGGPYHVHIWKYYKSQRTSNIQAISRISKRSKENT